MLSAKNVNTGLPTGDVEVSGETIVEWLLDRQPATVRPFDSGSQYADWASSNCERCAKSTYNGAEARCDLENSLRAADLGGGQITMETARRIGLEMPERYYGWPCAEVDWSPEWMAEWNRLHPE